MISYLINKSLYYMQPRIYISESNDPLWNLSLEEHIFELKTKVYKSDKNWIYIWRNNPVVVIGRNQNPLIEANLDFLKENNIELMRRKSGGGTVYHDLGNSCITIYTNKHSPLDNLKFVIDSLNNTFNIDLGISDRKDIFIDNKKVSGSAYRITSTGCYHHLTLLFNSDIDVLYATLQASSNSVITKATESFRSKVANLSEYNKDITHQSITSSIIDNFSDCDIYYLSDREIKNNKQIAKIYHDYSTWEWIYGGTPKFKQEIFGTFSFGNVSMSLTCQKGYITNVEIESTFIPQIIIDSINACLINSKYHRKSLREKFDLQLLLFKEEDTASIFEEIIETILKEIKF